jgi:hypothetical protein
MKKKNLIISLVLVAVVAMTFACGGSEETAPAPETAPTYDLLTGDAASVVFTNYATSSKTPAQFQLFSSELRTILDGETFPNSVASSDYHLWFIRFQLVIYGLDYNGTTISKLVCEKSENPNLQLKFDADANADGLYDHTGIAWQNLIDMQGVALIEDRSLYCTGDGVNFTVNLFKEHEISDDVFTLYFDFSGARLFKGRIVVTETGQDPSADGVVLDFE